jgi:hypothetical protein
MNTIPTTTSPDAAPNAALAARVADAVRVLSRALERDRALARLTREERERAAASDLAGDAEALATFRRVLDLELRRDRDTDDWAFGHLARAAALVTDWCDRHESVRAIVGAGVVPTAQLLAAAIVSALVYRWPDARAAVALVGGERAQRKAVAVEASAEGSASAEDLAQYAGAGIDDMQRSYERGDTVANLEQPFSAAAVQLLPREVRPRRAIQGKARNWAAYFASRLPGGRSTETRHPKAEVPSEIGDGVAAKSTRPPEEPERRAKKGAKSAKAAPKPEVNAYPSSPVTHLTRAFVDGDPDLFAFVARCPTTLLLGVSRGEVSGDFLRACIAEVGAFTANSLLAEAGVPETARALRLALRAALSEDPGSALRRGLLCQLRFSVGPWESKLDLAAHEGVPDGTLKSDLSRARTHLATEVFGPELFEPAYAWAKVAKSGPSLGDLVFA